MNVDGFIWVRKSIQHFALGYPILFVLVNDLNKKLVFIYRRKIIIYLK